MTKTDGYILEHLQPYNMELSDTYFCSIVKWNKDRFMDSILDKVTEWTDAMVVE